MPRYFRWAETMLYRRGVARATTLLLALCAPLCAYGLSLCATTLLLALCAPLCAYGLSSSPHPPARPLRNSIDRADPTAWNVTVDEWSKDRHIPSTNSPAEAALMSGAAHKIVSKDQPWEHLLQPAPAAPISCVQRGKFLVIGNKQNTAIVHLRLEGCIVGMTRKEHDAVASTSVSTLSFSESRMSWDLRRSYMVPNNLIEPGSSSVQNRTLNVLASFVSDEWAWLIVDHTRLTRIHVYTPKPDELLTKDDYVPGSRAWTFRIFKPKVFGAVAWDWLAEPEEVEAAFRKFFESDYA
ncbi:hypothetical protein HGRIS_005781 [Hohenbuehelia grisea]|uniref:Uncharacterized protein n=1 Tax=Hohenbuehelia grisea TaxID=104357 RepID=A0ABR3JYS2_9AGAR